MLAIYKYRLVSNFYHYCRSTVGKDNPLNLKKIKDLEVLYTLLAVNIVKLLQMFRLLVELEGILLH